MTTRSIDRELAALVGLGLPTPEGFRGEGVKLRDWLACRVCGTRGTTLHHVIPNWICRATGEKEILESLCPECHSAAEVLAWQAAEQALRSADLLARVAERRPKLRPMIETWHGWTRWHRRRRNLEKAGRVETPEGMTAAKELEAARRKLAAVRDKLRDAVRLQAALICLERIDYRGMVAAWRAAKSISKLEARRFVR